MDGLQLDLNNNRHHLCHSLQEKKCLLPLSLDLLLQLNVSLAHVKNPTMSITRYLGCLACFSPENKMVRLPIHLTQP